MKKIYSTLLILAAATSLTISAQQLPNGTFEGTWEKCYPWTSTGNTTTDQGTNPPGWVASNTIGTGSMGKLTVVTSATGYNSTSAATATNKEFKIFSIKKTIPGYFTLGTPWSTAEGISAKNKDGGSFGGIEFAYRPDAISFMYQSTGSTDKPTVVAYSWKGTYTQHDVPGNIVTSGSTTKIDMIDRDRHILKLTTPQGGSKEQSTDAECIAVINQSLEAEMANWTECILPFEYSSANSPQKLNIIFSAGNYFNDDPINDNSVTIGDVKLLYYSRLNDLSINGTPVNGFNPNQYTYTINAEMPEESAFSFETLGNSKSATAKLELDKENSIAKITVTNSNAGGTDVDGLESHIYTLKFSTNSVSGTKIAYTGSLQVTIEMMDINQTQNDQTVYITPTGSNSCVFALNNFAFDMEGDGSNMVNVGNIVLSDVKVTNDGTNDVYNGSATNMRLGPEGAAEEDILNVDVTLNGTIDASGNAVMNINVIWHYPQDESDGNITTMDIPIDVIFNGKINYASIGGIEADNTDAPVEYYNIQGIRVAADNLTPGIYIRRQGSETTKILIRH